MGPMLALLVAALLFRPLRADQCAELLASNATALNGRFYDDAYVQFSTVDGEFSLTNVAKLNVIGPVGGATAALCVGFHDTTTYTVGRQPAGVGAASTLAWVTMVTDPAVPAGVLKMDARCWEDKGKLAECSKEFLPMPGVLDIPMYMHSPLSEEFWLGHRDGYVFRDRWVSKMNFQSTEGATVPSAWVASLYVSSLKWLEVRGNDWDSPERIVSARMAALEKLDLTDNNLRRLPDDLFENTPNLQSIILARNNLSAFPKHLDALKQLRLLDLTNPRGNATLSISESELASVQQVQTLGLENVQLDANVSLLLTHPSLQFLNLSGCGIQQVEDVTPQPVDKPFLYLDLSRNGLTKLPSNILKSMKKLRRLDLHGNAINTLSTDVMKQIKHLVYLDVSSNSLFELQPLTFLEQDHLEQLDLSGNRFFRLPNDIFRYTTSLKVLKLSHNLLSRIHPDTFAGLLDLTTLDISYNNLSVEIYLENITLNILDLSHNALVGVSNLTASGAFIRSLDVSHNRISDWSMSSVGSLNLSYNAIADVTEPMLRSLGALKMVDLGGTALSCCGRDFTALRDWLRGTAVDVRTLGTKQSVRCQVPGNRQLYPAEQFAYGKEMCPPEDESIHMDHFQDTSFATVYTVLGVLSVVIFALAGALMYMLYLHRRGIKCVKHCNS